MQERSTSGGDPPHDLPAIEMPVSVEGVTAEWLTDALSIRYPGTVVEQSDHLDLIEGTATKVRVRNRYDQAGVDHGLAPTMIVKGGWAPHSEAMSEIYLREAQFYHHVAPRVALRMPQCHFAGTDSTAGSFRCTVVLEDLDARPVRYCHATEPPGYDEVARRLRDLAGLHSRMWDHPGFAAGGPFDWARPNLGDAWFDGYVARHLDAWDEILARRVGSLLSGVFRDRGWFRDAFASLEAEHRLHPPTLCHGDTHPGNLYVDRDGAPGFYDPYPVKAPWFYEITYHLVMSLAPEDRREWERSLLTDYLSALNDHGVSDGPGQDEAWYLYRRNMAFGLFISVVNDSAFQTDTVNSLYVTRFADAATTHRIHELF